MDDNLEELKDQKKFFWDTKNIIIIILSILLVVAIGSSSWTSLENSTSLTEKEKTIQANQKTIEDLQKENDLLTQEKQNLQNEKKQLQQEKNNFQNEKNQLQQAKQDLETQKSTLELENKNLKDQVEQLKKTLSIKNGSSNTPTSIQKSQPSPTSQNTNSSIVYVTRTGEKYHKSSCSYLRQSKIEINLSDAKRHGYTSCSRCY